MATEDQPCARAEHLDVLVVGAGLSGVGAGCYLERECPWASYAILEARGAIGGTWDLFRYPGVRSDSDMFTLGYSFRPWEKETSIADGASIRRYIRDTAAAYGLERRIRFHHRVVSADWSSAEGRWLVRVERTDTGETVALSAGFVFSCTGYYRYDHGYLPDFPGRDAFRGTFVHPQSWPEDLDHDGRRVLVVGSGATALTLVPALAERAAHVTMLQRSPTYVVSVPVANPLPGLLRRVLPAPAAAVAVRWVMALTTQLMYQVSRRWPRAMKRLLIRGVARQLPEGFDVSTHFTPRYDPWDQRLCVVPDGDLFRAIAAGRASVVTDRIRTFTETGVLLESGQVLEADVIVAATGLELLFAGGVSLSVDGSPLDVSQRLTYKGMMLEGVPNLAFAVGYTNASWTLKCDLTCRYVTGLLNHMHDSGARQCTPLNRDPGVQPEPLLGLTSGYVLRAADRFPKQGSKSPWRVHQSYLQDYRALRLRGIHDPSMVFSEPPFHPKTRDAGPGPGPGGPGGGAEPPLAPTGAPAAVGGGR